MAPSVLSALPDMTSVVKRYDGCPADYYRSGSYCYPNSSWYWWGRWVLAAVIIVVVLAIIMMLGCVNARRRKRRGMAPMYGTGWMGGKNGGPTQNNQGAYNNTYQYGPPPPQYTPNTMDNQTTGTTFNPNDGYYGGHNGNHVQQPQNTYAYAPNRAADPVYEPPPGPPPSKIA